MRRYVVLAAVVCAACGEPTATCTEWESCLPGNLVVRSVILEDVFPPKRERAGERVWGPGDTVAFRVAVENQSSEPVDGFTLKVGFGPLRRDRLLEHIIQLGRKPVPRLEPGERVQFSDTGVVAPETRATALRLEARAAIDASADSALNARIAGDTIVPVLSAGLELELASVPEQTVVEQGSWARWRARTEYRVVVRIANPYEVPVEPFRLTWCFRDVDFCPGGYGETATTPRVPPGEAREIEIPMTVINGNVTWFWDAVRRPLVISTKDAPAVNIIEFDVEALPNFEAECAVPAIVPGQQVTDETADCNRSGSAYRFEARAGERYRVEAARGSAFIVGPDGKPEDAPMQAEITIPRDGHYYVILDQRSGDPTAAFTLVRL